MALLLAITLPLLQLLLLQTAPIAARSRHRGLPCNFTSANEAIAYCQQFEDLYQAVHTDLEPWRATGIDAELVRQSANEYSVLAKQKGVVLGFNGGKAYVVEASLDAGLLGHHANIMCVLMWPAPTLCCLCEPP